jgi:hypothetical protein
MRRSILKFLTSHHRSCLEYTSQGLLSPLPLDLLGSMLAPDPALLGLALVPSSAQLLARTLDIELYLIPLVGHCILELGRLLLSRPPSETRSVGRLESLSLVLRECGDLVPQFWIPVDLGDRYDRSRLLDRHLSLEFDGLAILAFGVLRRNRFDVPTSQRGR